jgi:hypothetical protein
MNTQCIHREPVVSDAELHRFVADALASPGNDRAPLIEIERRLCDYHSSFALEEVTAHFEDGTVLPLIFKNLSPDCLLEQARDIRPKTSYDPEREALVYRDLLARLKLGTATCYAAVADAEKRQYWLLLEKVAGSDLARTGDFAIWTATARWLAEAHVQLTAAARRQSIDQQLMRYDSRCFHQWIDQAEPILQQPQHADGRAVAPWEIKWLVQRGRAAVRLVAAVPLMVIHGEFYPSNILIGEQNAAPRICSIDWETAGMGPGLLDLAALVAGNWTEPQKEELASAYFDANPQGGASSAGISDQITALRCCRLLLAMKWIGWSARWHPPPEHRYDWLAEALELARILNPELQQI